MHERPGAALEKTFSKLKDVGEFAIPRQDMGIRFTGRLIDATTSFSAVRDLVMRESSHTDRGGALLPPVVYGDGAGAVTE